jgi:hypothetical protein
MDCGLLAVRKHHVGEEALVTAQQGGGNERRRETHGLEHVPMRSAHLSTVMPALFAGIHVFLAAASASKA